MVDNSCCCWIELSDGRWDRRVCDTMGCRGWETMGCWEWMG